MLISEYFWLSNGERSRQMRSSTKKNMKLGLPVLAAAGMASLVSGAAYGSFLVSFTTSGSPAATIGGNDIWVLQQVNQGTTGAANTGTDMAALDVIINTPGSFSSTSGALKINLQDDIDGDGFNDANVVGGLDQNTNTTPTFGSALGTFITYNTLGSGATKSSGDVQPVSVSGLGKVYVNDQTVSYHTALVNNVPVPIQGNIATYETDEDGSGNLNPLDPAFVNGTVHSLEVIYSTSIANDTTAHKIANIVVPHGTPITAIVAIAGSLSQSPTEIYTLTTASAPPPPTLTASLTTTPAFTVAATLTVTGSQAAGYTPASASIPSAQASQGTVVVNGFQTGDEEIYALDVFANGVQATGAALQAIISELNGVASPAGTTVTAITDPRIAALFPNANVQVTGIDPADFNYSFSGDTTNNPTLISVGVVPEPTGVGMLVLGGMGLLARRRRATQA
jgi:hypothetical protein